MLQLNDSARSVLDALKEGITIIDTEGRLVFGNRAYREFLSKELGYPVYSVEGYMLRDLRPGARLPEVLKTGKAMLHIPRREIADFYFTNMYPIYQDGELIGGVSVVTFMEDAYLARDELEAIEAHNRQVLRSISKANGARYTFDDIVAVGENVQAVKLLAQKAAPTDAPVLLSAESGSGKELYAQAIHNASYRKNEVFVAINCANFNSNILESELFGYAEGAFTGAKKGGKIGLFEAAHRGTLFLDEISEMDMALQSKLLRAIQEGKVRPVGSVKEVEVDVRIICASNADLPRYIAERKFRQDLYYRLSTFMIHIPPLRERQRDIAALAEVILGDLAKKIKRSLHITPEALELLQQHDWPGNVRELRNVLEFSAYLSINGIITPESLPDQYARHATSHTSLTLSEKVRRFEREEIRKLLEKNGTDLAGKKRTAQELGISLATLYNKLSDISSNNLE